MWSHICFALTAGLLSGSVEIPAWLTSDALMRLVSENAPVFYLYPTDRFMPTPVEWFMARSELWLYTLVRILL